MEEKSGKNENGFPSNFCSIPFRPPPGIQMIPFIPQGIQFNPMPGLYPQYPAYFAAMNQQQMEQTNTTIQIGINPQFNNQTVDSPKKPPHLPVQESPKRTPPPKKLLMKRPPVKQLKMPEMEPNPVSASNEIFGLSEDPGFKELQKMAKNGCEIAEKLVEHHKKRPCFRKIDVLCSRLMQDLEKDNYKNVVANINSQGIAWAVKDFIFTFTRIVNAWVIMRGYVYNRLDGLDKIKDAVDPELTKNFLAWQDTTSKMVDSLVKSFVSLDQTVQNQRGASSKNLKDQINESFNQEEKSFQDSYFDMSTVEESEEAQRKYDETGTYFKSAIYHPIQKDSPKKDKEADLLRIFNDDLNNSDYCFGQDNETIPDSASFVTSTPKKENPFQVKLNLIEEYDLFGFKKQQGSGDAEIANMDTIKLDTWKQMFGLEAEKIRNVFQEILALKEADSFYCPSISRFCLPKSLNVIPENDVGSVNLNTILYKLQYGRYFGWKDMVFDLHQMVDSVKACLKNREDSTKWTIVRRFETDLEKILSEYHFQSLSIKSS